jgi:ligand-binding sensor domain-containing protein
MKCNLLLRSVLLHIILCWNFYPVIAQSFPDLRFTHLSDRDGLSSNRVNEIVQDDRGIIWVTTEHGFDRFDGYGFKAFYLSSNSPFAQNNNNVIQLVPDKKGNLWGSTSEGLFCFNTYTQGVRFFTSDPKDPGTFRNRFRPQVYIDSTQLPWVMTLDGLYRFRDSLHYFRIADDTGRTTGKNSVYGSVFTDRSGELWTAHGNTIFRLNRDTKRVEKTYDYPGSTLIMDLLFDHHGRFWVCTWGNGIFLFDPAHNSWQPFHPSAKRPVVRGVVEWTVNGNTFLVFSCSTPALLLVDERDLSVYSYPFDGTTTMLNGPPFVDRQNVLWVPMTDGLYYTTSSSKLFHVIDIPPVSKDFEQPDKLSYVYNLKETPSGYWLSKRDFGGIFQYDRNWRPLRSWTGVPQGPRVRSPMRDTSLGEAYDFEQVGKRMYMTVEGGISVLDLGSGSWLTFVPQGLRVSPRLRTICVENDSTWWVRSFNLGVFIFDPRTGRFVKHYSNGSDSPGALSGDLNYLLRDKRQRVWVTTTTGLFRYDPQRDRFVRVVLLPGGAPDIDLFGMSEDKDGVLWIGAQNGMVTYDADRGKAGRIFTQDNRIGRVYRVDTDPQQNIWFNSNSGYWCWLRGPGRLIHFEYGLGIPETYEGIVYTASDGAVYCGGKDAIVGFLPNRLLNYKIAGGTSIVEAVIHDSVPVPIAQDKEGQKTLTLAPEDNSIQVWFDVINYDLPATNEYYYRLTPGDKGWSRSQNGHLSFYSLQSGRYVLEVKGGSSLTDQFTAEDRLAIVVRPYWYQSSWFMMACVLVAAVIVALVVRFRIGQVRKEGLLNQKLAEIEMTALRAQMNPHFIFNSLNSIESFIMQNEKRLASDYLNKFAMLMRMILENSRKSVVSFTSDMEALRLYVDLEKVRFEDKFRYITEIDPAMMTGDYKVAPLLIQPFVENAIIHGIAPSERKDLYLRIAVRLDGDYIRYTIEDNGIGRPASLSYTTKSRTAEHKSLGLQISRERIDIINRLQGSDGTLEIIDLQDESRQPAGTRVLLTLKIA